MHLNKRLGGDIILKFLFILIVATAIFYNGTIFFFSDSSDVMNPNIAMSLKMSKDVVIIFSIVILFYLALILNCLKIKKLASLYLLYPVILGLLMAFIALQKYEIDSVTVGILKNYIVYYFAAGILVVLAKNFNKEKNFFDCFRFFMAVTLLIGLGIYIFIEQSYLFAFEGRMISVLGNPNYLGYLSALYLVILHGIMYYSSKFSKMIFFELAIAFSGLIFAMSFAALVSYFIWMILMLLLIILHSVPKNRIFYRFMKLELATLVIGTLILSKYLIPTDNSISLALSRFHYVRGIENPSVTIVSGRLDAFSNFINDVFSSWGSFFIGTLTQNHYVETDGALINIGYNFGIPMLLAWLLYFSLPVILTVVSLKKLRKLPEQNSYMVIVLAVFIFSSLISNFWLQYLTEKFPTNLFIGWIMAFVVFNTLDLQKKENNRGSKPIMQA